MTKNQNRKGENVLATNEMLSGRKSQFACLARVGRKLQKTERKMQKVQQGVLQEMRLLAREEMKQDMMSKLRQETMVEVRQKVISEKLKTLNQEERQETGIQVVCTQRRDLKMRRGMCRSEIGGKIGKEVRSGAESGAKSEERKIEVEERNDLFFEGDEYFLVEKKSKEIRRVKEGENKPSKSSNNKKELVIYADGSVVLRKKRRNCGGWAVCVLCEEIVVDVLSGTAVDVTSNQMELEGCLHALLYAYKYKDTYSITLNLDCCYLVEGIFVNYWSWKSQGFKTKAKKRPVCYIETWHKIMALVEEFSDLKIVKVSGHSGIEGNELVDKLAREKAHERMAEEMKEGGKKG